MNQNAHDAEELQTISPNAREQQQIMVPTAIRDSGRCVTVHQFIIKPLFCSSDDAFSIV